MSQLEKGEDEVLTDQLYSHLLPTVTELEQGQR